MIRSPVGRGGARVQPPDPAERQEVVRGQSRYAAEYELNAREQETSDSQYADVMSASMTGGNGDSRERRGQGSSRSGRQSRFSIVVRGPKRREGTDPPPPARAPQHPPQASDQQGMAPFGSVLHEAQSTVASERNQVLDDRFIEEEMEEEMQAEETQKTGSASSMRGTCTPPNATMATTAAAAAAAAAADPKSALAGPSKLATAQAQRNAAVRAAGRAQMNGPAQPVRLSLSCNRSTDRPADRLPHPPSATVPCCPPTCPH